MKRLLFLFALSFAFFLTSTVTAQDTIHVPADFSTIQEAINAATNGDLVLVSDGLYYENINFRGKAITVASNFIIDPDTTHISHTILDGSQPSDPDSGSVVTFNSGEDTTSVLCGFRITGGSGTILDVEGGRRGGGILTYNSGVKIINNIIDYNTLNFTSDASGAGISANTDPPYIRNFVIENNIIGNNSITTPTVAGYSTGGGIHSWNTTGYVRIANNKIINNTITAPGAYGGGLVPAGWDNNNYFVLNNLISGNILNAASGGSGGIDVFNHNPVIKNNLIVSNSAPNGGGLSIESAFPIFINNTIANNTATNSGGGIDIIGVTPAIMNCIIRGNTAPLGQQIDGNADVQYSDIQGGFTGTGNIDADPLFDGSEFYLLGANSPCIDSGNPDPMYNDVEDPGSPGNPLMPAQGTLRNDIGHLGGPASVWSYWNWPMPIELTSFTALSDGKEVVLSWSTATEINNQGFNIERSINNVSFEKIGFIPGFGTSTEPKNYSYSDQPVNTGMYYYRLNQIDYDGSSTYSNVVEVEWRTLNSYLLEQNYPNPFNPTTTIGLSIPAKSNIKITILNAIGEEVAVVLNEEKDAGYHQVQFNASNLPSGVYFYQLRAGDFFQTKKMILIK